MADFREQLEHLINWNSKENGSNTPDFLLAEYLTACLTAFDNAVRARDKWYSVELKPGRLHAPVDDFVYDEHGPAAPGDGPLSQMSPKEKAKWADEIRDGM